MNGRVAQIVNDDLRQFVRGSVDGRGLQVHRSASVVGLDRIDDPLTQLECGALLRDIDNQVLESVVCLGEYLIVEKQHHACEDGTDPEEWE